VFLFASAIAGVAAQPIRSIPLAELHDRIAGGWAGQMIGVSFGAPTEFRTLQKINEGELPKWTPDKIKEALDQDDLYVDMTFAQVLDDKGLNATTADFGNMFRDARYRLWHANLAARRALKRDIPASLAGTPKYNAHANDIDFQIESDFIGLMSPGMPASSNSIADRAGRVMNSGDGLYGGMFVSCMYAAAFFETKDVRRVVEAGVACLPAESPYTKVVRDVLTWSRQYPDDWRKVWHLIGEKWDRREPCPEGALKSFNIDAKLNGAYVALGLLYGGRDFTKTIDVATRAGQDSDCNPSSAAGVLGVMLGYKAIPDEWKSGIPALADKKFNFTNFTFNEIVASTQKRAIALAVANGGKLRGDVLDVKIQTAKPARLEIWDDYGSPVERIAVADSRWTFTGSWSPVKAGKTATVKGAEAQIEFTGSGAIAVGLYQPTGGRYDVYLDGKLDGTLDSNSDEADTKSGESIWHKFGLANGKHTLRLVVRGEPFQGHSGTDVTLTDLVVFRP